MGLLVPMSFRPSFSRTLIEAVEASSITPAWAHVSGCLQSSRDAAWGHRRFWVRILRPLEIRTWRFTRRHRRRRCAQKSPIMSVRPWAERQRYRMLCRQHVHFDHVIALKRTRPVMQLVPLLPPSGVSL